MNWRAGERCVLTGIRRRVGIEFSRNVILKTAEDAEHFCLFLRPSAVNVKMQSQDWWCMVLSVAAWIKLNYAVSGTVICNAS